jgi:hypothetical protein
MTWWRTLLGYEVPVILPPQKAMRPHRDGRTTSEITGDVRPISEVTLSMPTTVP